MGSDSVRKLFPQLLRNGYVPIPNYDKVCKLPGWPSILVDEDQCRKWARQLRWTAIGLRVEQPLLVMDFDLPDPAVMDAIRAIAPAAVLGGLERIGNPPKTAFFLRMNEADDPFREMHTRRYHFEGRPKPAFQVQAFGGGHGAQVGAFGPHSHDDHGNVLLTYQWIGPSPADVPIDQLPEMTRAEVNEFLSAVDVRLAAYSGLVVDTESKSGEVYYEQHYWLDDSMVFKDAEGFEYTLDELREEAKARTKLKQDFRITGSFTNDPHSTGSARCRVRWSESKGLAITDYKNQVTSRELRIPDDPELDKLFAEIFTPKRAV